MSDVLEIRVKKSHIAVLSVVVLVASASAAVNFRDSMNVFGDLDMQGNKVVNATEYRFTSNFVREYDKNNNGQIEIEELGDAGRDFLDDELSIQKLQVLGEYFTTGKQVSRGVKAAPLSEDGKIIASGAYTGTKNGPTQAGNFTFSSDINLQNNNIYNIGNLDTGGGTGTALDWENARSVADRKTSGVGVTAEVSCNADEILVSAACTEETVDSSNVQYTQPAKCDTRTIRRANVAGTYPGVSGTCVPTTSTSNPGTGGGSGGGGSASNAAPPLDWSNAQPQSDGQQITCDLGEVLEDVTCSRSGSTGIDNANSRPVACESRTRRSAKASGSSGLSRVTGTCVPIEAANAGVFTDQNTSNTFQVPPGTSRVEYKVYGGVGGGVGESGSGGAGGYVEGSIPVDGETTLNVYVGQNGGNGEKIVDRGRVSDRILTIETEGTGGRGGCVPYNGVKCGGNGGDGYLNRVFYDISEVASFTNGAGGGGAPTVLTDSTGQMMLAAGGGGGQSTQSGGGGGAGGGKGSDASSVFHGDDAGENPNEPNAGQDADDTTKNLGGNADEPGGTFVRSGLPEADSTGTSREGAKVELAAFP